MAPWKGAWPVEGGVPPARVPQATPPCPADARPTQPVPGTRAPTLPSELGVHPLPQGTEPVAEGSLGPYPA